MDLLTIAGGLVCGLAGAAWSAWRLKGDGTWTRTMVTVLGGPRPTVPKRV
jgi:hypothetical protein